MRDPANRTGLTHDEIARDLGLSPKTVRSYIRVIGSKPSEG